MNILYFDIRILVYRDLECKWPFFSRWMEMNTFVWKRFLENVSKTHSFIYKCILPIFFCKYYPFPISSVSFVYIYGLLLYTSQSAFSYKLDLTTQRIDNNTVIIMHEDAMIASFVYYFTPNTFVDMFFVRCFHNKGKEMKRSW